MGNTIVDRRPLISFPVITAEEIRQRIYELQAAEDSLSSSDAIANHQPLSSVVKALHMNEYFPHCGSVTGLTNYSAKQYAEQTVQGNNIAYRTVPVSSNIRHVQVKCPKCDQSAGYDIVHKALHCPACEYSLLVSPNVKTILYDPYGSDGLDGYIVLELACKPEGENDGSGT